MARMLEEHIPIVSTPFKVVWEARAILQEKIGFRLPRPVLSLLSLYGLSTGSFTLWLDPETGYFVEAREKEGSRPIYHAINEDRAINILKHGLTHDEFELLKIPDDYIGE